MEWTQIGNMFMVHNNHVRKCLKNWRWANGVLDTYKENWQVRSNLTWGLFYHRRVGTDLYFTNRSATPTLVLGQVLVITFTQTMGHPTENHTVYTMVLESIGCDINAWNVSNLSTVIPEGVLSRKTQSALKYVINMECSLFNGTCSDVIWRHRICLTLVYNTFHSNNCTSKYHLQNCNHFLQA